MCGCESVCVCGCECVGVRVCGCECVGVSVGGGCESGCVGVRVWV